VRWEIVEPVSSKTETAEDGEEKMEELRRARTVRDVDFTTLGRRPSNREIMHRKISRVMRRGWFHGILPLSPPLHAVTIWVYT